MRLLLLAGGEVALVAMLLVGSLHLLPSGEPGLAVLLRRVLILFLSTGEVGADRCGGLLGHRGSPFHSSTRSSSAPYPWVHGERTSAWRREVKGCASRLAGPPGFEPGLTDPESVGLPLPDGPNVARPQRAGPSDAIRQPCRPEGRPASPAERPAGRKPPP